MRRLFLLAALCVALLCSPSWAAGQQPIKKGAPTPNSQAGRSNFNSTCAACHGLDGRGGDKAPNIATSGRVQHLSDAELSSVISNGVPGTGMPAFRTLSAVQVRSLVRYLRSLQGKREADTVSGDSKGGEEIFFGKGDCSSCHTISGRGGFLGPDLTNHAATSSFAAIKDQIVKTPRVPSMGYRVGTVITSSGDHFEGLIRNEDNYTLQLQTQDGQFHFFKKIDLQKFAYAEGSLMPSDYGQRLSDSELNDLASYLMTTSDATKAAVPSKDDFE